MIASFAGGPLAIAGAAATLYAAWPTYVHAIEVIRREHRLNVDVQDGLAIALSLMQRETTTAALITWLLRLGDWIRDLTAARSHGVIDELLDFQSQSCWVVAGEKRFRRSVDRLRAGNIIAIDAGSVLPVDGTVMRGIATVDQSAVTGESLPITATRGRAVYAGTSIQEGHLHVRATAVGPETTVARIVRMVKDTPVGETRAQNYAEKFADRLVAPMLAAGLGLAALTGDVERLVSMLIVDYGTGIRIAAPTAILSTITRAARHGVLIKSGAVMEKLASVDAMLFDKTGTLTRGTPRVLEVLSYLPRLLPQRLLSWVAAAEARQRHPVAQAILERARREHLSVPTRERVRYNIGRGVEAQVSGHEVWVGSGRFMTEKGVALRRARADLRRCAADGCSALLVAVDGELAGALPYADEIRPEMPAVLDRLHARGIRELTMITGDDAAAAGSVARRLGFDDFQAEVSPAEKAECVARLHSEGHTVAMIGDGINDAAALAKADVGVAVKNGTDITRQVAHVLLMQDSMWQLVSAIDSAREAVRTIHQSFATVAAFNTLALLLALPSDLIPPNVTALISNGSAVIAALNAIRGGLR